MNQKSRSKYIMFVQFAVLLAVETIFCFTPLGSIPLGPVVATTAMIPVIITSILLGTAAGALMGVFTGFFSFIIWTFTPPNPAIAFLFTPVHSLAGIQGSFWSVVTCFVPRIMIGIVSGLFFGFFKNKLKNKVTEVAVYGISAVLGSFANTFFVLLCWQLFFVSDIAKAFNISADAVFNVAILSTLITNGLPEMAVSAVAGIFICMPLRKILVNQKMI